MDIFHINRSITGEGKFFPSLRGDLYGTIISK
jgi:hypothetical protein